MEYWSNGVRVIADCGFEKAQRIWHRVRNQKSNVEFQMQNPVGQASLPALE